MIGNLKTIIFEPQLLKKDDYITSKNTLLYDIYFYYLNSVKMTDVVTEYESLRRKCNAQKKTKTEMFNLPECSWLYWSETYLAICHQPFEETTHEPPIFEILELWGRFDGCVCKPAVMCSFGRTE